MPLYLISYRKTDGAGQKPEWASFTTQSESSWGNGEVIWIGASRLDDVLYRREEAAPETSIVYGVVEQ